MTPRTFVPLLTALAALSMAGCGSSSTPPTSSSSVAGATSAPATATPTPAATATPTAAAGPLTGTWSGSYTGSFSHCPTRPAPGWNASTFLQSALLRLFSSSPPAQITRTRRI